MRKIHALLLTVFALLALASSACSSYRILQFADHDSKQVTRLETMKTTNYLVSITAEHQFWLCTDTGNALVCERRCGGETDLECPQAAGGMGGISTNVR